MTFPCARTLVGTALPILGSLQRSHDNARIGFLFGGEPYRTVSYPLEVVQERQLRSLWTGGLGSWTGNIHAALCKGVC